MILLQWFKRPAIRPVQPPLAITRWPLMVGGIVAIWLSFYLYVGSLNLPFLQEDSTHIRWLSWHSLLEPFFTAVGAPDYRPLGKIIIKFWYLVLGEHDRPWLRFHNIILNVFNIVMVAKLATWVDRGRNRYVTGGLTAIFFAVLPFSYQAIPWINNFFYPLANFLLLTMTAVYWQARVRQSNWLLAVAFFLCFLAPFEIEYGLMSSSVLFLVELTLWLQKRQPYPWLGGPALGLAMNILFLIRSLTIPKQPYFFGPPTLNRLWLIGTYFLQGLMYPISPLATRVMTQTGWSDVTAIWAVCLPPLLLLVGYLAWQRKWSMLLMGGAWFMLLNIPALVFVNFDYVVNGPRLLYPPGVGVAWLWGGVLAEAAGDKQKPWRWVRGVTVGAFLLVTVIQNVSFVQRVMSYYHLAERPFSQLMSVARQTPTENKLLIVNFPSWITPNDPFFAMGNHGAQFIPFYIDIQDVIYAHNDADHPAKAVQFLNIRTPQPYYNGMLGETVDYDGLRQNLSDSGSVYVTTWGAEEMSLVYAGRVTNVPFQQTTAVFDETIALQVVQANRQANQIILQFNWQLRQKVSQDLTVFVHLYGPDGVLLAQADGYPLSGLSPFWLWEAGQILQDQRQLKLPPNLPNGSYHVAMGIYNPADGQRLAATDATGNLIPDNAVTVFRMERP